MRITIQPLEQEYQTIQIRTTELESYHTCAFKHRFWKQEFSNNDALLFGSLTHAVLQAYFFSPEAGIETLGLICTSYEQRCSAIGDYLALIDSNLLRDQYKLICTEYKCVAEIEVGKYLIILEGTIDAISKIEDRYTIIDFKTSKAERKPDQYESKIQKFIYPRLLSRFVGEDKVKAFDYMIFTKHVKPRLQILKYEVNREEVNKFISDLLIAYCESHSTNMRNPNICTSCFFCPLKTTCPLKQLGTFDEF